MYEKRDIILNQLYSDRVFGALQSHKSMLEHILKTNELDISELMNEMKRRMEGYKVRSNQKSSHAAKMFESSADKLIKLKVNNELNNIDSLYTKAIENLPAVSDLICKSTEACLIRKIRLYSKRAKLRFDMHLYEQAIDDVHMAIYFRDQLLTPTRCNYVLEILGLRCISKAISTLEIDRAQIDQLISDLQNNDGFYLEKTKAFELINKFRKMNSKVSNFSDTNDRLKQRVKNESNSYFRYEVDERIQVTHMPNKGRIFMANGLIPKGTVLLVEKPCSAILMKDFLKSHCNYCMLKFAEPSTAYPCEYCKEAMYCSIECFEEAYYLYHQYECGFMGMILGLSVTCMHVFRLINYVGVQRAMQYDRECNPYSYTIQKFMDDDNMRTKSSMEFDEEDKFNLYRMSTALIEHRNKYSVSMNAYHAMNCLDITLILAIQNPELFSGDSLKKNFFDLFDMCMVYVRRITVNVFGLFEYFGKDRKIVANCEYLVGSLVNHSCDPNVDWSIDNGHIVFKANRDINVNEELNITYGQTKSIPFKQRQDNLQNYFFFCRCSLCLEDVKSSKTFTCQKCHEGAIICTKTRAGCQLCGSEIPKDSVESILEEIDKHQKVIDWHQKLVRGFHNHSNLLYEENLLKSIMTAVNSGRDYLMKFMFRKSIKYEEIVQNLAKIYLHYEQLDNAFKMAVIFYEQLEFNIDSLKDDQLDIMLVKLNFWTEICNRYCLKLMQVKQKIDNKEVIDTTAGLFVRFLKVACAYIKQKMAEKPDLFKETSSGKAGLIHKEYNDAKMILMLSEKKKTSLINIVEYYKCM